MGFDHTAFAVRSDEGWKIIDPTNEGKRTIIDTPASISGRYGLILDGKTDLFFVKMLPKGNYSIQVDRVIELKSDFVLKSSASKTTGIFARQFLDLVDHWGMKKVNRTIFNDTDHVSHALEKDEVRTFTKKSVPYNGVYSFKPGLPRELELLLSDINDRKRGFFFSDFENYEKQTSIINGKLVGKNKDCKIDNEFFSFYLKFEGSEVMTRFLTKKHIVSLEYLSRLSARACST